MKIAVVSSGLWHIRRGVETWAGTLAKALAEKGVSVTLFTGSAVTGDKFKIKYQTQVIPCWYRGTILNRFWTGILSRLGGWRYGFGSEYQTEQATMARDLTVALKDGGFDIVHLQDPWLALLLEKSYFSGKHSARVILAHGTEEPMECLSRVDYVQELSPYYLAHHNGNTRSGQKRFAVPNFVDVQEFKPGNRTACRRSLEIPESAFVVLSVGAVDHSHKRMAWLVDEFASTMKDNMVLVIAGSCNSEEGTRMLARAEERLGRKFLSFINLSHDQMPDLYRSADVLVLCSLAEIFGISFLEAMASGVPCIGHIYPVTEWIIGEGGTCIDMTIKGTISMEILQYQTPEIKRKAGELARKRAVEFFSAEVVISQIVKMYEEVGSIKKG